MSQAIQNNVYREYPLGAIFLDRERALRVCAHLESKWIGLNSPWYGVALEVLAGSPGTHRVDRQERPDRTVKAGTLPETFEVVCINGSGRPALKPPTAIHNFIQQLRGDILLVHFSWYEGDLEGRHFRGYPDTYDDPGEDSRLSLILNGVDLGSAFPDEEETSHEVQSPEKYAHALSLFNWLCVYQNIQLR